MLKNDVKYSKLSPEAFDPEKGSEHAAGIDLRATSFSYYPEYGYVEIGTGLSFEIPEGFVGLLFPRSSISNTPHFLRNCVGVIDSDYRGEVKARMGTLDNVNTEEYSFGDRVVQLVIVPYLVANLVLSEDLSNTERGSGGFGSSGR